VISPLSNRESRLFAGEGFFYLARMLFLLLILSLFFTTASDSRTWYIKVDGSGDAPTIQAGVDSSAVGDTVLVAAGSYSDSVQVSVEGNPKWVNVFLYKNITLLARKSLYAVIDGPRSGIAVYAEAVDSTASIEGFTIRTSFGGYGCVLPARSESQPWVIGTGVLCSSASVRIIANDIVDHDTAIRLVGSPVQIYDNHIHRSFYGIDCSESSDALIYSNRLHECAALIHVVDSSPDIVGNKLYADVPFEMVCEGISCYNASAYIAHNEIVDMNNLGLQVGPGSVVEYNKIIGHWTAMYIYGGDPVSIVRYNLFYSNGTCIEQRGPGRPIIENNTFDKCATAVFGGPVEFRSNIVTRAAYGLFVLSDQVVVECNNLFDISDTKYANGDRTGMDGNISVDPQFCGIYDSDNYYLQSDSPCAPGNRPDSTSCGLIGAFGVNCGMVDITETTWGIIKNLYRGAAGDTLRE
jgi:hypothetical protein